MTGVVRVSTIGSRIHESLGDPVGMLSGRTMTQLFDAVRRSSTCRD